MKIVVSDGFLFGFLAVAIASQGFMLGRWCATNICRDEAIKAGVGRWTVDSKTDKAKFVFGVTKEVKP